MQKLPLVFFGLLAAAMACTAAAMTLAVARQLLPASPCAQPAPRDPMAVAQRFLHTAVARENLASSYQLVGPLLKGDMSCREWMTGTIPVQPFQKIQWSRVRFHELDVTRGHLLLRVDLVSRSRTWGSQAFALELTARKDGWVASSWAPWGFSAVPA